MSYVRNYSRRSQNWRNQHDPHRYHNHPAAIRTAGRLRCRDVRIGDEAGRDVPREDERMRFISLFSGIGGFDLGFERTGMECVAQVEIDKNCRSILERHYPNVRRYEDIKDCHSSSYLDNLVRTWYPVENEQEAEMAGKLKKLTPEQAEECVKLYDNGLSLQNVADYFDVSRQAMWDLLRRRTKMRSQKKYGKDNHFYRGGKTADDKAQNILEEAIERGIIIRKDVCETCGETGIFKDGRTKVQAHHPDYNKPLEVMWLCQKCHHEWHKNNKAKGKEVLRELPATDVICGGFP